MLKIHVSHRGDVVGRLQLPTPLEEIERQMEKLRQPGQILDIFNVDSPKPKVGQMMM